MPDVFVARQMLEQKTMKQTLKRPLKQTITNQILTERLIGARQAAYNLNLPLYLLSHPCERLRIGVPHYRVGKMVRFKMSELMVWMHERGAKTNA